MRNLRIKAIYEAISYKGSGRKYIEAEVGKATQSPLAQRQGKIAVF
jgi:hypothetical protein